MPTDTQTFGPALKEQTMPSRSIAQKRWAAGWEHNPEGMRGKRPKMSREELHKFAHTPDKGLPKRAPGSALRRLARGD